MIINITWKKVILQQQRFIKQMQGAKNIRHHQTRNNSPEGHRPRQSSLSTRKQMGRETANQTDDNTTHLTAFSVYNSRIRSDIANTSQIQCASQMYTPAQNIVKLLKDFKQNFKKLLAIVPIRYKQLIFQCEDSFQLLSQVLNHYPQSNHLSPYYYQMHSNSTDTKNNLLKMLNQQQIQRQILAQKNKDLQYQVKKLTKLIKCKDQAYMDQAQRLKQAGDKLKQLQKFEARCEKYEQKISQMRQEIIQKDQKMRQLEGNKQQIMNDLIQIESQIKTLNYIPESQKNFGQNRPRQKSCKKIRMKVPSKAHIESSNQQSRQIDEDLYRCLLLQASTIQQQILYD